MSQSTLNPGCFDDLIALRGACYDTVPTSSLWLNDLGIDMNFVGQVITKDYKDADDFFNRKRDFAVRMVSNQIHNFLRPKYKASTVIENFRIGQGEDNLKQVVGSGFLKGIEIDLCQSRSYLDVYVSEIALQISTTQSVDVLVYDLVQNKLLDTITVDCVANEITRVYIKKTYKAERRGLDLFIGYDSTGISANTTRLKKNCINCSGNYQSEISNSYSKIRAVQIDQSGQIIKSNLDYLNETGGLSVVHSLGCNHENWLCSISNQMAFPILYKTAALMIDHGLSATQDQRANTTVTINKELWKERMDRMEFYYSESMNNLLQNIKPPSDEICFACKDNLRHVIMLP